MTNQGNPQQQGFVEDSLHGARQQLEGHIGDVIDQYAGRVPGGDRFTPEAKKAVGGILDGLQKQLEAEANNRLGGGGTSTPATGTGNQQPDQGGLL
ncbi:hypothetical protein KDA_41330 [Dictyobacter alpinus]|uniref:Uncharacterized protein n=1 Tax=Dictyobacter alpinus TaxID=2014873 RepID=A0A402BBD7_9CHLR|nr:hypothetical protein [Dictyobacter alpinus]GCE28649.1 hypothetical protein KDA_41330 [Dictyobacter alpinus]